MLAFAEVLANPFALGLGLGLFIALLALWRVATLKWELRKARLHLGERLELEADAMSKLRTERETLRLENEQLRIKIATLQERPDWRAQRELEVFARAEKRMLLQAPGFAPAWEQAKTAARSELEEEEAGRSLPKRVFNKLFGAANQPAASSSAPPPPPPPPPTLPDRAEEA